MKPDSGVKSSFHFEPSYTGPTGGTYTAPSIATGNSYASVYKFPFQSTDTKESSNKGAAPFKYSDRSNTLTVPSSYKYSDHPVPYKYSDSNYESSCYSIYNCDTNESSNNSKSKSTGSYFGSRESDNLMSVGGGTMESFKFLDRQNIPSKFDSSTLKDRFKQLQVREREKDGRRRY